MISSVSSSGSYSVPPAPAATAGKPSQLPSPPAAEVPDEGLKLAAAKALIENPVAVAAISDNAKVDALASDLYVAQQKQQALETYSQSAALAPGGDNDNDNDSSGGNRNPLAIAAASDNPQVDELATTVYQSRQALKMVDYYSEAFSNASGNINDTA